VTDTVSITNLRKLENAAAKFGLPDDFEARFAKGSLDADELGVSLQKIAAGQSAPFAHRHSQQPEELYVVVAGSGTITVEDEEHDVETWDVVRVDGQAVRSFAAGDDEDLEFLAFGLIHPSDYEMVELEGSNADGG
jgi:mannose-6-phosphate isomerase-like protein (cupin superfamily)